MNYDKLMCELFFENDWKFKRNVRLKYAKNKDRYSNIEAYLKNRFIDSQNIRESLYRIKHNLEKRPVCKTCGNTVDFVGKSGVLFRDFCSVKCAQVNKEVQQKKAETDKSHHNGKRGWNFRNQNRIDNREKTILQRYGDYSKALNIEKRKQTCIERYGGASGMSSKEVQLKRNITILKNHGVLNPLQSEKVQQKQNKTRKKNYNFRTSKQENIVNNMLLEIYPDLIRGYCSDYYHWNCDFYVPSEDLYIEYHGSHFHNNKPFEGTEEDLQKLEHYKIKSEEIKKRTGKSKSQYDIMIYTWTDLDVRKRNHCKEHNINYLEFYSIKEVEEYIKEKKENI